MGCHCQAAFYIRGRFLTCCLQMLRNRHRRRCRLHEWGCVIPWETWRSPSEALHLNFLIWKIGTLLLRLLAVCFTGTARTESRLCEGFELSDYIKVKVLRTEISKLQGKSAWSLKMLPWKSQCWYDFCQREFFPPIKTAWIQTGAQMGTHIPVHHGSGGRCDSPDPQWPKPLLLFAPWTQKSKGAGEPDAEELPPDRPVPGERLLEVWVKGVAAMGRAMRWLPCLVRGEGHLHPASQQVMHRESGPRKSDKERHQRLFLVEEQVCRTILQKY